jgi:hypothetical protein
MWVTVKYWQRVIYVDIKEQVRQCSGVQKCDTSFESCSKEMKEGIEIARLTYM